MHPIIILIKRQLVFVICKKKLLFIFPLVFMFKSVGFQPFRINYWPAMLNFGSALICRPSNGQSCLLWIEWAKKFRQGRLQCEKLSDDDGHKDMTFISFLIPDMTFHFVFNAGWDIYIVLLFSSQFFPSFVNDWSLRSNNILIA